MNAIVCLHGRGNQMAPELGRSPRAVERYVDRMRRTWLSGLAKGLVLAGEDPVPPAAVYLPFYGNDLADAITAYEASGGRRPELELAEERVTADTVAGEGEPLGRAVGAMSRELVVDAAEETGFRASQHLAGADAGTVEEVREVERMRSSGEEASWSDLLQLRLARSALRFLSDKTGTADWVIEQFLRDVAYYLADERMRDLVQGCVRASIAQAQDDGHDELVVVSHSLGTVVAYDALQQLPPGVTVRLLVTAGSPLGQKVVRRNLRGPDAGAERRAVPAALTPVGAAPGWVNAYDLRDVVAVVHPLAPLFAPSGAPVRDERTYNPRGPHSIEDYLADPDVAGPVARALADGR